jgi:hypothetical protein
MDNQVQDRPNLVPETVPIQEVGSGLDSIAQKMAAMRNQVQVTKPIETGVSTAAADDTPVAPEGVEVLDDNAEPEIEATEAYDAEGHDATDAPEEVSPENSTSDELIDFLDFANTNPNAKFKFMRNGKEVVIDAKKAASILGQGAAISEDARQLKVERAEFDEYLNHKRSETEGLLLAMEFTVRPQLQKAYDEILKTQSYQTTFQQQLAQSRDPAQVARIQAAMQQNERYIQQQSATIGQLKPNVDQFYQIRSQQVQQVLESNRKNFQDKELRNSYVYNEIREKVSKDWDGARRQLVAGIDNIDLISSDEHLLSLVRDGLKYRDRPKGKSAGGSLAVLTNRKAGTAMPSGSADNESNLREKAKGRGKEATQAADNLLVARLQSLRSARR